MPQSGIKTTITLRSIKEKHLRTEGSGGKGAKGTCSPNLVDTQQEPNSYEGLV